MSLLELPPEILTQILALVGVLDLASFARTSRAANQFIKGSNYLFQLHYLQKFDDPRPHAPILYDNGDRKYMEINWIEVLQHAVKLEKILASNDVGVKKRHLAFIEDIITRLIRLSAPQMDSRTISFLNAWFKEPLNEDEILCRSGLYFRAYPERFQGQPDTAEDQQLSAKLHCFRGMSTIDSNYTRHWKPIVPYARSQIYDVRNYTSRTGWGPFCGDGSMKVDWQMMEAIMIDITFNTWTEGELLGSDEEWGPDNLISIPPWCEGTFQDILATTDYHPMGRNISLDPEDPYRVTGRWYRLVCFLDSADFHEFNQSLPHDPDEPGEPIPTDIDEVMIHITMDIKVTKVGTIRDCGKESAIVYFQGKSTIREPDWVPNAGEDSGIRGNVRLTPEGDVRWSTVSIIEGEERWRSEGIQIGGIGSERGVVGTWFQKDYNSSGPVGPTVFFKQWDDISDLEDKWTTGDDELFDDP